MRYTKVFVLLAQRYLCNPCSQYQPARYNGLQKSLSKLNLNSPHIITQDLLVKLSPSHDLYTVSEDELIITIVEADKLVHITYDNVNYQATEISAFLENVSVMLLQLIEPLNRGIMYTFC